MGSALVVIIAIGLVWAAFLVPPMLSSRRETPLASTAEYHRVASRLARAQAAMPMPVSTKSGVLARRRKILVGLVAAAAVTLMYAIIRTSLPGLILNLVIDGVLAWYVTMLLQIKQSRTVTHLQPRTAEPVAVPVQPERPAVKVVAS